MLGFESADALKAYVTCLLLGISLLFAYNALLSTPVYFKDYYKFAQDDENATTSNPDFWKNVVSTISLVANIPNLCVQACLLHSFSRKIKQHHKLVFGLILMSIALILIPLAGALKVGDSGAIAYLMCSVILCAMGTGVYQSTVLSLVSGFPPNFVGICIVGIGVSGIISNIIAIVTQASMPDSHSGHEDQARIFYGISGGIIVITLIALSFFKYNPYARRFVPEYREAAAIREEAAKEQAGLLSVAAAEEGSAGQVKKTIDDDAGVRVPSAIDVINKPSYDGGESNQSMATDSSSIVASKAFAEGTQLQQESPTALSVLKLTWDMQISILVTFIITLFIMPALAVAVDPKDAWYPILVITIYNVADTFGRYLSGIKLLWVPRKFILPASVSRVLLIGLWFLAYKTEVITGHTYPMILMGVTGLTNGHLAGLMMVYAPQTEGLDTEESKNISGNMISFMLLLGCSIGATLGWLVTSFTD